MHFRPGQEFPPQRYGGEHFRPDGYECAYLSAIICDKCGGTAPRHCVPDRVRTAHRARLRHHLETAGLVLGGLLVLALMAALLLAVASSGALTESLR